jgi:hypothetical protein
MRLVMLKEQPKKGKSFSSHLFNLLSLFTLN